MIYTKQQIIDFIMAGNISANVSHVSQSGMQREIKFFVTDDGKLVNITHDIADLYGSRVGKHYGVVVRGCGMDMVFHTLYSVVGHENYDGWSQRYNTI